MTDPHPFRVVPIAYDTGLADLRAVRDAVFVQEQGVPLALERDALDPSCRHVIARDDAGRAIGTGRLVPPWFALPANMATDTADANHPHAPTTAARIGRMAVVAPWRGRGVGEALLQALVDEARAQGWRQIWLHAQAPAIGFYVRLGFLPVGERFLEAGIEHLSMRRVLDAANPVENRHEAQAALLGVIGQASRSLYLYSRELDPGLLDAAPVLVALRRLATRGAEIRVLLHDPAAPQRAQASLIGLAQRLPSAFAFRAIEEVTDKAYPAAYAVDDRGGYYFRTLGHRFDGETRLDAPARARQLRAAFDTVWQRARPCTEYRALGF